MRQRIILFSLVTAVASCSGNRERPDQPLTEKPTEEKVEPTFDHPDRGPVLRQSTGALKPRRHDPVEVEVDRIQIGDGEVFVAFDAPPSEPISSNVHLRVDAGVHGVAVPGDGTTESDAIVRFVAENAPREFTIHWDQRDRRSRGVKRRPGSVGTYRVTVGEPTSDDTLSASFWESAARWFQAVRSRSAASDPFFSFAGQRLQLLVPRDSGSNQPRRTPRTDVGRTMELYSGMSSINEALQSDRGLVLRRDPAGRTVPIDEVEGVPLAEHPWKQMIAELETRPTMEPLASVVPADMAYVHFNDVRAFVRLVSDLDDWVSPVAQWLEQRPGASHFLSGYERQLVVERTGLAEALGHVAVSQMAIVTSDPFVREGTDVSMIFGVKNRAALLTALKSFEASTRRRRPDLKEASWKVGDIEVRRIFTPDGVVDQHRVEYDGLLVISNSPGAVRHLLSVRSGATRTLAETGDFRYMRARYPWKADTEDGFVFFGDAFVARAVSPEVKILEARRLSARADLQAVNHAALLYGWMQGERPGTAKQLSDSRYLDPAELTHPDGTPITFDPETGARSERGSLTHLTPIRDQTLDEVTEAERDAYVRFRDTYQNYWRRYIDPIAARITRSRDGSQTSIDARMLPLIEATEYDELLRVVGREKVLRPRIEGALQWTFAVGKDAELRRMLDGMARSTVSKNVGLAWLGRWAMVGVADRSGLWDLALLSAQVPQAESEAGPPWMNLSNAQQQALGRFPVYVGAHVANKIGLAAVLAGLKKWVEDAAPGMISWGESEPYRDIPIVRVGAAEAGTADEIPGELGLHYATVGDVFIASLDRSTLEILIDRALAGDGARPATGPPSAEAAVDAQTFLDVSPGEGGWLARALIGLTESTVVGNHSRALLAWSVLRHGLPGVTLDGSGTRRWGLAYLGYEPRNPNGGRFSTTPEGRPTHSLYGDGVAPAVPPVPIDGSTITRVFERLEHLSMSLDFEGEGDHQALHSTLEWRWN